MKNGTLYAKRVNKLFTRLKSLHGAPEVPELTPPIDQLILSLLSTAASRSKARHAAQALQESMVDINDLRVSTAAEVANIISPFIPNCTETADAIHRALNVIFRKQNAVTLDHLPQMGRREAKHYLEQVDGISPFAAASVILWSLGGHAIPVDRRLYDALRKEDLIDPSATIEEVQAFLERNISAADAQAFCLLMPRFIADKSSGASPRKPATPLAGKRMTTARSAAKAKKSADSHKASAKTQKRSASR